MRILTRYVLLQVLAVFAISLGGMTLVMMTAGVLREMLSQGLGIAQALRLLPYVLPDALRFAVPATILFSVCNVFGRMASSNEVVAIKAMGISPWAILWPVFAAVTFLSLGAVWINDLAVSWGREGIRRVVIESVEEVAYSMLSTHRSYSSNRFSITVKRVDDRRLIQPTVTFQPSRDAPIVVIRAEWAELSADTENDTLTIRLHNGSAVGGGIEANFPGTVERVLPLSDASRKASSWGPSHMPLYAIPDAIAAQRQRLVEMEQSRAAEAGLLMLSGEFDGLFDDSWRHAHLRLQQERRQLCRLRTEPHRRWANGFSCLCFAVVGAPLAMRMRKAEFWTTFFLCFLPILLVYYPLLQYSVGESKTGALPPVSVWMGNVALLLWGGLMLRKVLRY